MKTEVYENNLTIQKGEEMKVAPIQIMPVNKFQEHLRD